MGLNRVSVIVQISFVVGVFLTFSPNCWAASANGGAEYLGGTVHAVQSSTRGTLELGDSQELVFQSRKSAFRLPYDRISGFHFSEYRKSLRKFAGVRIPTVSLLAHDQVLDLRFQELDGSLGTASFRIDERTRSEAEPLLSERIPQEKKSSKHSAGVKLSEEWWGDKNWKTTRNKARWPEPPTEGSVLIAEPRP